MGTVFGVGINDADYKISLYSNGKCIWKCPYYFRWRDMLQRCYCESSLKQNTSYLNCFVTDEWHRFSIFRAWMCKQDWQDKELDKDLLVPGNKEYGPHTCLFIDRNINVFINDTGRTKREYPLGVSFHKETGKFRARCEILATGKQRSLGLYWTPEEAHTAWLAFKLEQAHILAEMQEDERVAKALISRYENYSTF